MTTQPRSATLRPVFLLSAAYLTALATATALPPAPAPAQEAPPGEEGIFLTVPNPITGSDSTNRLKESIERALREKHVRKIVFDFNPDGKEASSRDFGPCSDLAKELAKLPVITVAFVHNKVSRHTVLPVLACREVVMSSDASLGPVWIQPDDPPDEDQLRQYGRLAGRGREAVVLKMLDPNVVVMEGRRNNAVWYFDGRKRDEAVREGVVAINPQAVIPAGAVAQYPAADARRYNLCQRDNVESRQQVAELYQLPPSSLREDPLQGRTPNAWRVEVHGEINKSLEERLRRRIDKATRSEANVIILQLEASGGSYEAARDLADFLHDLRGPDGLPVVTVAFIPQEAPDTATFLALGCTEIVMGKDATLGNFSRLLRPPPQQQPGRRGQRPPPPPAPTTSPDLVRDSLKQLAQEQGYPPLLIQGLFDTDLEIYRVRNQKGAAERRFVTKEELDADRQGEKRWVNEGQVKAAGQLLELTAAKAKDYGIARYVVDNPRNLQELYALYGLGKVQEAPPDWLEKLAIFLGDPVVAMFLVIIGVTCLILELKMPGIGVPGVIAALCFVLFFWAQWNGQVTLLAVLLFLLGLVMIGIEVFLLPGFGVTGISGILLVLAGLGLATVDRMPQTSQEWVSFGQTLTTFGFGLIVATAAAFTVARYLPNIPYANRLVLAPPGEKEGVEDASAASGVGENLVALLGAVGTAATVLRPAGMARFGDAYVDVVTEGGFVPAGARVQVIEIEGTRVVVKEV